MVLPVLVAIIAAPALLGTQEAIRQSQAKEKREEHRARRCNLIATCVKSSMRSREINGRPVVLRDGKLWIDTGSSDGDRFRHPYAGYYLPYPDTNYEGLVTTITDTAPIMNWVYVDKDTYEVKYGVRLDAQPNYTGPFDCTRQDRRLTFDGWEGWCAVEEFPSLWALYFDKDDDGLRSKVAPGTRVLEVELTRREKRWQKEADARQQDQTTQRAVDAEQDAPVENLATAESAQAPGVPEKPPTPFKLPKSIFSDPPRPIFMDPQGPTPPKTPPPAYSTTPPPAPPQPSSKTPPNPGSSTSPPAPLQTTPLGENRTTPKLNRSSGTQTLAKAQMFEAMALGQKPNNDVPFRNGRPPSRPTSNRTSVSDYSNPPQTGITDIFNLYLERPTSTSTTLDAPSVPKLDKSGQQAPPMPMSDPAVFGGFSGNAAKRPEQGSKLKANDSPSGQPRLRRKESFRATPDSEAPKPLPARPAPPRSTKRRPGSPPDRGSTRPPASDQRPPPSGPTRNISPESSRRPPPLRNAPTSAARGPARPPNKRSSPPPRGRNGSTSSQSRDEESSRSSPRPLARTNTAPVRKSMAQTMTSGTQNRGMATRVSGKDGVPDMPRLERSQTNSSLYREIDDLVSIGRNRSGTAPGSGARRENKNDADRRPPPLRRAATSRAPMRDNDARGGQERARDRPAEKGTRKEKMDEVENKF